MKKLLTCWLLTFLLPTASRCQVYPGHIQLPTPTLLQAQDFGAVGDGVTDDGPAVVRMLDAAAKLKPPVRLQFAPRKTYFLKTGRSRYALPIEGAKGWTLDGGDSVFLVDSQQRFLKLRHSQHITVRCFKVDYVPLPFADGTVVAKDKMAGTLDVQIEAGQTMPPTGGATREDGEQAYFGSLWQRGVYSDETSGGPYWVRHNFEVQDVRPLVGGFNGRVVRVWSQPNDGIFDAIEPGQWRFSVPVRGIAHRFGPGESFQISENRDLTLENIELWSAPWFAFGISGNRGRVVLRHVNVRPRPGTSRLASAWRDGFHIKNNRASLLWEDCTVQGTGDDAFNIASHTSVVREVLAPTRLRISQNYPLGVAAMEPGDTLVFYGINRGVILGRAHIVAVEPPRFQGERAPLFTVDLDTPIEGLEPQHTLVWNEQSSNPNTILRRCRMDTSCRFRSSLTLDSCQVNALAWFTGDAIEAPLPTDVEVVNSVFRLGQGNPRLVIVLNGPHEQEHSPTEPVLQNFLFDHNQILGDCNFSDVKTLVLRANQFAADDNSLVIHNAHQVWMSGNTHAGQAITSPAEIGSEAMQHPEIYKFANEQADSLMLPFARFYAVDAQGEMVRWHALPAATQPTLQGVVTMGGPRASYRIPLPALPGHAPTYLEANIEPKFKAVEFATFVPQNGQTFYLTLELAKPGQANGRQLLQQILTPGHWQTHHVALDGSTLPTSTAAVSASNALDFTGWRVLRLGLSVQVDKTPRASAVPVAGFLGDVRLLR